MHQATTWVWEQSKSCGLNRYVLLAIANRYNPEKRGCWPSVTRLSTDTGLSDPTVKRAIRELCDSGELAKEVRRDEGANLTNFYRLPVFETWYESIRRKPQQTPMGSDRPQGTVAQTPGDGVLLTPESVSNLESVSEPKERAKSARPCQWPVGFRLTAELFNHASRKGLTHIEDQWEAFENYHRSKGTRFLEWNRAWYTWVGKAIQWRANGNREGKTESFDERRSRESAEAITRMFGRDETVASGVHGALPPAPKHASTPRLSDRTR